MNILCKFAFTLAYIFMDTEIFQTLVKQFNNYPLGFEYALPLESKFKHCHSVANIAKQISEYLIPSKNLQQIIEIAALYHDIGRFEQYAKYNTFVDSKSENHAALSVKVIKENNFLSLLDTENQKIIEIAILNHNTKKINSNLTEIENLVTTVLRDADKIDILGLFSNHYADNKSDETLELNLPDIKEYNPKVVQSIISGELVDMQDVKTLNDFKLLKMSWVYDLNYEISHVLISNGKYLRTIFDSLSVKDEQTQLAFNLVDGVCEAYTN